MAVPERTEPPWQPDDPWFVYLGERQALLRDDMAAATAYGATHPDVWGGAWWGDDARLKVGLTVLNPHAAAIRALLTHPAEVDIVAVPRTAAAIKAVEDDVRADATDQRAARHPRQPSLVTSVGVRDGRVRVDLHPAGEALARQLHARHGDAVELWVGALPYPPDPAGPPPPTPGPVPTTTWPELVLSTQPATTAIRAGDDITGTVTITNTGRDRVLVEGGQPLPADLVDTDGHLAGSYTGWIAGTAFFADLAPGQSRQVDFLGGTAGTTTYLTPPGRYDLVVSLDLGGDDHHGRLITPPIPIDVHPA